MASVIETIGGYRYGMGTGSRRDSLLAAALTVAIALGVCAMAAAVMVPTMLGGVGSWPVLVAGCVLMMVGPGALWIVQRRRERTLR
jgi:hypothetical protein